MPAAVRSCSNIEGTVAQYSLVVARRWRDLLNIFESVVCIPILFSRAIMAGEWAAARLRNTENGRHSLDRRGEVEN